MPVISGRWMALLAIVVIAALTIAYVVVNYYVSTEAVTEAAPAEYTVTCRWCITSPPGSEAQATTVIEGVEYYVRPISPGMDLGKGVEFHEVKFVQLPVTTTGCSGDWFLVLFPDGASEVIQIYYACTGTPVKEPVVLSRHECPRAGVMYENGGLYLLVSKGCVSNAEKIVSERVGDWIIRLVAPSNISLSNPKLLYELIYAGRGFSAASTWLPPTWCRVLVRSPSGSEVNILDRGMCPWIRINGTFIQPGYTYKHWIDLSNIVKEPGEYTITVHVSCTLKKISYKTNSIEDIPINATLTMEVYLE